MSQELLPNILKRQKIKKRNNEEKALSRSMQKLLE